MENTQITQDMQTDSTVIDTDIDGVKSGGGKPPVEQKPEPNRKAESARESLEAEAKKLTDNPPKDEDDEDEKPAVKDKAEAKTEKVEEKPAKTEESARKVDASEQEAKNPKPSEGRRNIEAPARFLPNAKDAWRNVPRVVQEEWARSETEREAEIAQYREHKVFREELKDFEDLAKRHNVPFKQALDNYVKIEKDFAEDPAKGFRQLCQNLNISAPQAIGHILRSANVTIPQLIEHMQREPHQYTSLAQRPQPQPTQEQQPQITPEVRELQQQIQALRAEQVANAVIAPFAQDYPEYHQHEEQIAKVLQSGIIEQIHGSGLSPRDKLEAALFMVAPHVRRVTQTEAGDGLTVQEEEQSKAPAQDVQGGKSVKSSIGGVTETTVADRKMSMRDMLEEEARKISRRA